MSRDSSWHPDRSTVLTRGGLNQRSFCLKSTLVQLEDLNARLTHLYEFSRVGCVTCGIHNWQTYLFLFTIKTSVLISNVDSRFLAHV